MNPVPFPDRVEYRNRCVRRWDGPALTDSLRNWRHFKQHHAGLTEALRRFNHDPFQRDSADKCHNPEGTLAGFLWQLQAAWQPDRSQFDPLLDFCDHHQSVHLRRGLLFYCGLVLDQIRTTQPEAPGQFTLQLTSPDHLGR